MPYAKTLCSVCTACFICTHCLHKIHVCWISAVPAQIHVTERAVHLFWHTAWPRTWRLWRKTSGSKIKAVSSSVPPGKLASCCFKSCWSATSSPRLHSSGGDGSPLRAKHMKTWLVGRSSESVYSHFTGDSSHWEGHFAWHCVLYASRYKRWWTLRSLMIMLQPFRAMMLATAAWEQPEPKQGL